MVGWRIALGAYLVAGLAFALMAAGTGVFGVPGAQLAGLFVVASYVLLWPTYVFAMLGLFGFKAY